MKLKKKIADAAAKDYMAHVYPTDVTPLQDQEIRKAFRSGVYWLLVLVMAPLSDADLEGALQGLTREYEEEIGQLMIDVQNELRR